MGLLALAVCLAAVPQDPAAAAPAAETWTLWDRLKFYANGRLRGEGTFDQPSGEDRYRGRLRMRVGGEYLINEKLRAEARLSTASDGHDANNPHWDFGDGTDGLSGTDVVLDRMLLDWDVSERTSLLGGKFSHVFARPPVYGEYAWDDDVQPAGGALLWTPVKKDEIDFDLRVGGYVATENSNDEDPAMLGGQGNVTLRPSDATQIQLASGLMDWGNLDAGAGVAGNQGNTTDEFTVWQSFLAGTLKGEKLGNTTLMVEFLKNLDDDTGEDQGFAFGAQVGRSGKKGDANVYASFYDLDANCVFSNVAQDDTPIAGTGTGEGMDGIIAGVQYFVQNDLTLRLSYLTSDDGTDDPSRVRFDVEYKIP